MSVEDGATSLTSERSTTSEPTHRRVPTVVLVVALCLTWSIGLLSIKAALAYSSPGAFAFSRTLVAAMTGAVAILLTSRPVRWRLGRRATVTALVVGVVNLGLFSVFQTTGMAEASVGVAGAIIYSQPLWVAGLAALVLGERLGGWQSAGILLGWLGVILIVVDSRGGGETTFFGTLMLVGAAVTWAAGTLMIKWSGVTDDAVLVVFWSCVYAAPVTGIFAFFERGSIDVTWQWAVAVAWAGAGGMMLGFGLQLLLLARGRAAVVSSWIFPVPVLTLAFGVLFFGDRPTVLNLVGCAAVASSLAVVNRPAGRSERLERPSPA